MIWNIIVTILGIAFGVWLGRKIGEAETPFGAFASLFRLSYDPFSYFLPELLRFSIFSLIASLSHYLPFTFVYPVFSLFFFGKHFGILAAVAHFSVDLAAGLPVHPAGRQPQGKVADVLQQHGDDAAGRAVARRGLEFRDLGRSARDVSDRSQDFSGGAQGCRRRSRRDKAASVPVSGEHAADISRGRIRVDIFPLHLVGQRCGVLFRSDGLGVRPDQTAERGCVSGFLRNADAGSRRERFYHRER